MNWYLDVLKKYQDFSSRSRRMEFWMFALINCVVGTVLYFVEAAVGLWGILSGLYGLVVLVPGLAVSVRRLHDTGREWYWILVCFIPIVGWLALIYFMFLDSEPGTNKFGPNPKGM